MDRVGYCPPRYRYLLTPLLAPSNSFAFRHHIHLTNYVMTQMKDCWIIIKLDKQGQVQFDCSTNFYWLHHKSSKRSDLLDKNGIFRLIFNSSNLIKLFKFNSFTWYCTNLGGPGGYSNIGKLTYFLYLFTSYSHEFMNLRI